MCILLGSVQLEFDIKLLTKLLVYNFMLFPAGAPHQLFQVAPPLVTPCFAVVLCPEILVVHA